MVQSGGQWRGGHNQIFGPFVSVVGVAVADCRNAADPTIPQFRGLGRQVDVRFSGRRWNDGKRKQMFGHFGEKGIGLNRAPQQINGSTRDDVVMDWIVRRSRIP